MSSVKRLTWGQPHIEVKSPDCTMPRSAREPSNSAISYSKESIRFLRTWSQIGKGRMLFHKSSEMAHSNYQPLMVSLYQELGIAKVSVATTYERLYLFFSIYSFAFYASISRFKFEIRQLTLPYFLVSVIKCHLFEPELWFTEYDVQYHDARRAKFHHALGFIQIGSDCDTTGHSLSEIRAWA